ncbi:hypothetical protein R1T40_18410 [Tritonibacter scottomollicae]|uniref:Uncharacterized protein n=1 Tax=Tritonibacter scottomollicae TaxID=483013 RepID=A0ABZ0HF61_TRISK|nr:hypothetical protein [Tritonibacter scottomollicae]WOI32886.1 hypothetical protein R1T40_18410 [Tritonibacter scottomollicae]
MRSYDADTLAYLANREGLVSVRLVWITARNQFGAPETLGLCSAEDDLVVRIGGQDRTYLGAGPLLQSEPISAGSGLQVRVYRIQLSAVAPEVEDLVKGYETRFAPIEVHRMFLDPATRVQVGQPHRVFRGSIDGIDFPRAEPGGTPAVAVQAVSETRVLTRQLPLKKSDESHRRRDPQDEFRKYGDISGSVPVYWGELRS